ncbi:MAG: amidohydrolase [Bacilli bacterium]|nr:amidohydrolase [Bacilli bacterium]MBN2877089.1 amidohydrolase [Bacilli bacterium]
MNVCKELEEYIIQNRRHLHRNPELGFHCTKTHDYVVKQLKELGIQHHPHIGKNSVIGVIRNGEGPTVGLRADFDALPIQEETNLEFRSQNDGKMHACGHDAHTGMLLGAAKYLSEHKNEWKGTVKLIFQEAEEGPNPGGALGVVASSQVDDVDTFFALHVSGADVAGTFLISEAEALASADTLEVKFIGKGAHAAYPHLGIDPIVMQAQFINAVQSIVSRKKDPMEKGVITIAQVKAGTTHNIIPEKAVLLGTVRTYKEEIRQMFEKELRQVAKGIAEAHGGTAEVKYIREYDALINTKSEAIKFEEVAADIFGEENVIVLTVPSMGAEDFSRYVNHKKGAMAWLGVGYKDRYNYPIHHPKFEIDETALIKGAQALINIVKRIGEE